MTQRPLNWDDQTVFKDAVLGYIHIPKAVVEEIIDNRIFQRLHDVAQTGMETLYPGATHNRFCHSIGVYHLGKLAFQCFQQNVKKQHLNDIYYKVASSPEMCERVWNRWRFLFEMACLLHDCGHSPLSHSLEFLYDIIDLESEIDADNLQKITNRILLDAFKKESNFEACFVKNRDSLQVYGAPHERMSSCLIVLEEDGYRQKLDRLIRSQIDYFDRNFFTSRPKTAIAYNESALQSDLEFMVRAIIGCPYNEMSPFWGEEDQHREIVYQLRNCIINLLNGTVDVDNIDYSIRDATVSGYKSAQVDYERLLKSNTIAIAYEHMDRRHPLVLKEDPFDYSICLHSFVSDPVAGESASLTMSGSATLVVSPVGQEDCTGEGTEQNQSPKDSWGISMAGTIWEDDESSSNKQVRTIHLRDGSNVRLQLNSCRLQLMPRDGEKKSGAQLYIHSSKLSGELIGTVFVGEQKHSGNQESSVLKRIKAGKLKIHPAYHKSALSVIQGALDASNFEQRWIYSHHATTYNNNFLSVFLLERYANFCFEMECSQLLDLSERFLACYPSFLIRSPAAGEDLRRDVQEWFGKTKNNVTFARQRLSQEVCGQFPQELPDLKTVQNLEVYRILLQAIGTLCRVMPMPDYEESSDTTKPPTPFQARFHETIGSLIHALVQIPSMQEREEDLSPLEKDVYTHFKNQIAMHTQIRKLGVPIMSALLGMPYAKAVNGKKYYRISDSDLRSMYHSLVQNATDEQRERHADLFHAIEQYESRNYLPAMWKSHAEFHFYVQGWEEQWFCAPKMPEGSSHSALSLIQAFFSNDPTSAGANPMELQQYTYFSSEMDVSQLKSELKPFWEEVQKEFQLDKLVYVPQRIKHKELKRTTTYAIWKDRVVTLRDIGLHTQRDDAETFFYLYYERKKTAEGELDVARFMEFLRERLDPRTKANAQPDRNADKG